MSDSEINVPHADVNRTRTFSWEDPMVGSAKIMTMSGLDYLKEIEAGTVPLPSIDLLKDFRICEI